MAENPEWDTTKENIRPIRQGRPASAASFAEIFDPKSSAELQLKRTEFETRIRNYQGEDPLAEWVAYINWVEACYPRGGAESGLADLIKKCCQKFHEEAKEAKSANRYGNDERYIQLWIKMSATIQPLKLYPVMHKSQVGILSPDLYIHWAAELESLKSIHEAEAILDKGIQACAGNPEYVIKLENQKKALLDRDSRKLMGSGLFGILQDEIEEERNVLGGLKPVGKQKRDAPVNRVGDNKIHLTKGLVSARPVPNSTVTHSSVHIFDEESTSASPQLPADEIPFPSVAADGENSVPTTKIEKTSTRRQIMNQLAESQIGFEILADPPDKVAALSKEDDGRHRLDHHRKLTARSTVEEEDPLKEIVRPLPDVQIVTNWANVEYNDPSASKREPISDRCNTSKSGEPAPPPAAGQLFMWAHTLFVSGIGELSFEEGLALSYRNTQKARRTLALQQKKDELADQEERLQEKLEAADVALQEAEDQRRLAEEERMAAAEELRMAEDVHLAAEGDLYVCEEIVKGIGSCLTSLHKDILIEENDLLSSIYSFARNLFQRLDRLNSDDGRQPVAAINMMLDITSRLVNSIDEREQRIVNYQEPRIHRASIRKSVSEPLQLIDEGVLNSEDIASSQGSGTSWQSSQPIPNGQNSMEQNPLMAALWNQTLNGTSREKSQQPTPLPSTNVSAVEATESGPESDPTVPIRQSLAARKCAKAQELDTSSTEKPDDLPTSSPVHFPASGFQIFQDEPSIAVPNSPHSRSFERPPKPVTPILTEDSDDEVLQEEKEEEPHVDCVMSPIKAAVSPAAAERAEMIEEIESNVRPPRRTNVGFFDEMNEFNLTRKSVGAFDQTIQLGSESQFFSDIDQNKRMASTPKCAKASNVTTDKTTNRRRSEDLRRQARVSTYFLSPIVEGSRENKTSSSSSGSTTSTQLRSKKSATNYETVHERDEDQPVDPYSGDVITMLKERLYEKIDEDPRVVHLDESLSKIIPGRTVVRLEDSKFIVEEELGSGNYATVYRIRCRTDISSIWALKVQKQGGWWDFYIHSEALRRISSRDDHAESLKYIVNLQSFYRLTDGSTYSLLQLHEQDTVVRIVNAFRTSAEKTIPEPLAMKITCDVLRAVEILHSVNIIHGDIKADNFLVQNLKELTEVKTAEDFLNIPSVALTDFGCGIDTTLFDPLTTFSTCVKGKSTAGFEILQSKPWTYQIDYFGVLDVIHTLLFGEYMKVYHEGGVWKISKSYKTIMVGDLAQYVRQTIEHPDM